MDLLHAVQQLTTAPQTISVRPADAFDRHTWPVHPGNYVIKDPLAPIGLVFLGSARSSDFPELSGYAGINIIGNLTTENIGLEYVIKNIISNPHIRHLFITEKDIDGHFPGDALIALIQNGMDNTHRIKGARGARPFLKNILPVEIEHFRRQITVHDCRQTSLQDGKNIITKNSLHKSPVYKEILHVRQADIHRAQPAKRLTLDPEGYFIILTRAGNKNPLYVEHYKNNGRLAHIIEGKDAPSLCATIISMQLLTRLDHAAYLGRELAKAELDLLLGIEYTQDKAQGDTICTC